MKQRTNFTLTPEAIDLLRGLAERTGLSMSAILELAVREWAAKKPNN